MPAGLTEPAHNAAARYLNGPSSAHGRPHGNWPANDTTRPVWKSVGDVKKKKSQLWWFFIIFLYICNPVNLVRDAVITSCAARIYELKTSCSARPNTNDRSNSVIVLGRPITGLPLCRAVFPYSIRTDRRRRIDARPWSEFYKHNILIFLITVMNILVTAFYRASLAAFSFSKTFTCGGSCLGALVCAHRIK